MMKFMVIVRNFFPISCKQFLIIFAQGVVKIVWSHASSDDLSKKFPSWNANHFVCMLPFKKNYYKGNEYFSIR